MMRIRGDDNYLPDNYFYMVFFLYDKSAAGEVISHPLDEEHHDEEEHHEEEEHVHIAGNATAATAGEAKGNV